MPAILRVKEINKIEAQAENATKLDVTVELLENDTLLETRNLNFPLDITEEELKSELTKFITTYNQDMELKKENEELDAANASADKVIENMTGLVIEGGEQSEDQEEEKTVQEVVNGENEVKEEEPVNNPEPQIENTEPTE